MYVLALFALIGPNWIKDRDSDWAAYTTARAQADGAAQALSQQQIIFTPFRYDQAPEALSSQLASIRSKYSSAADLHRKYIHTYMASGQDSYAGQLVYTGLEYLLAAKAYKAETTFKEVEDLPDADHPIAVRGKNSTFRSASVIGIYLAMKMSELQVEPPYSAGPALPEKVIDFTTVIGRLHFEEKGLPQVTVTADEREAFSDQFVGLAPRPSDVSP